MKGVKTAVSLATPTPSKEAIVAAATQLFKEKGYRGASLEDVARVFGVSRPAIYHYFKSKQDILLAIYREVSDALSSGAQRILKQDLQATEKFQLIVRHHAETILRFAPAMAVYYDEEFELSPRQRRTIRSRRRVYTQSLVDLYAQGVRDGEFTDLPPKLAVYAIIGACNWSYKWFDPEGSVSPDEMTAHIERLLSGGYQLRAQAERFEGTR